MAALGEDVRLLVTEIGPVFEALDENEVALQAMMGNRFMGHFETQIASWRGRLSGVRSTLDVWLEVQRS